MAKKYLLTFAEGDPTIKESAMRLKKEATTLKIFDEVINYDGNLLKEIINERITEFINSNKRGYGLWIWKPIIVREILKRTEMGDVVFYADAGCEFDESSRRKTIEEIGKVEKYGSRFYMTKHNEIEYSSQEIIEKIRNKKIEEIKNEKQIQATFFILRNDEDTRKLIENWYELALENDAYYLKDNHQEKNKKLIEIRHDQSILSLLVKNEKKFNIDKFCYNYPENYTKLKLKYFDVKSMIYANRNRTGLKKIKIIECSNLLTCIKYFLLIKYHILRNKNWIL